MKDSEFGRQSVESDVDFAYEDALIEVDAQNGDVDVVVVAVVVNVVVVGVSVVVVVEIELVVAVVVEIELVVAAVVEIELVVVVVVVEVVVDVECVVVGDWKRKLEGKDEIEIEDRKSRVCVEQEKRAGKEGWKIQQIGWQEWYRLR